MEPALSIIVPVLEEAALLRQSLAALQPLRARGHEVVVADGGSADGTPELARPLADAVVTSAPGRARQMNAGAARARGRVLLFLHVDTALPAAADEQVLRALASGARWGRFDVRLSGAHPALRVIERAMNLRSRLTGIATGDQALFVCRERFESVGGFPDIALMEDIALSARLRALGAPACVRTPVTTSSRRWERDGILRTVLLMWRLRLAYFLGADPAALARRYHGG